MVVGDPNIIMAFIKKPIILDLDAYQSNGYEDDLFYSKIQQK